jgi:hypothetical protein
MENDIFKLLEAIALTLAIISPGLAAIIGSLRTKFKCITEIKKDLEDLKDSIGHRQLRQSKALIILANRMDDINKIQHADQGPLHLGNEIETILKDEHGRL